MNLNKLLQGRYSKVMVKLPTQRIFDLLKQCRIIICGQGMQRKRRTEQLSLENSRVMEVKFIKHDGAIKELKEFRSAWAIEQPAYTTPWMEQGNVMRLNDREGRYWKVRMIICRHGMQRKYGPNN